MLFANCSTAIVGDIFRLTWHRTMAGRSLDMLARLLENVVVEYCTHIVQNVLAFLYDHMTGRAILVLAQLLIVLLFLVAYRYFSKNRRSHPVPNQIIQPSTWSHHQPVALVPRASIYFRMLKNREETRSSLPMSGNKNNMSTILEHSLELDLDVRPINSPTQQLAPTAQIVPSKKPVHTEKYDETLDEITWGCENDPEVEVKGDRGETIDRDDSEDSDSMISAEQSPFRPEINTSSEVEFYMGSENNPTHMTDGREEPPELAERILSSLIPDRKKEKKNPRVGRKTKKTTRHKLKEIDESMVNVSKPATRSRSVTPKKRKTKYTKQKVSKGVNTVSLLVTESQRCGPGCSIVLQDTQAATSPQEFLNLLENMTTSICQQLTRQVGESGHMSEEFSSNTDDQNESDTCGSDPQDDQYEPIKGGSEPHFPGNRSESSLVCKRDSWIWFSPELRPSLEDFAARQRKFQSRDPRVAELADEIRRQERMNRDIERAAESLIDSSSPSTGRPQPPPLLGVFNFSDPRGAIRTKGRHSQPRATPYPLDIRRQGVRLSTSLTNAASWKSRHSGRSEKRTPTPDLLESPLSSRIKLNRSTSPDRRSRRSYSSSSSPKRRHVRKKTVSPVGRRRHSSLTDRHSSMSGRPSSLSSRHSSMSSRRSSLSGRHSSLSGKRSIKKHPSTSSVSTKPDSVSPVDLSPVCLSPVGLSPVCLSPIGLSPVCLSHAASLPSVEDWLDSPLVANVGMSLPSPGRFSSRFDSSISSPESKHNLQSHRPPVSSAVPSQHALCPSVSAGQEVSETTSLSSQTYNLISPSSGHLRLFQAQVGFTSPRRSRIRAEKVKTVWPRENMIQSNPVAPNVLEDVIRTDRPTRGISPGDFSPTRRAVPDRLAPLTISITPEWPDGGKPVRRSPQMTFSTGESESDSAYRDRSGGPDVSYRQCVISKEVNTTVQRLLFDTEKSSSSHSPSSKSRVAPLDRTEVEDLTRQSKEMETAGVQPLTSLTPAISSENEANNTTALSQDQAAEKQPDEPKQNQEVGTPEQEPQVEVTNRSTESKAARSRSRSASQHRNCQKCTNIYTPDYYLGKRVVMRQQREYNKTSESPVPIRGDVGWSRRGGSTRKSKFTKHRLSVAASKQKCCSGRFLPSSARAQLRGASPRKTARKGGTAALNSSTRSPKSCRGQRSGRAAASTRSSAARTLSPGAAQEANDSKASSIERSPRANDGKKSIKKSQWKSSRPPVGSRGTVKSANTSVVSRSHSQRTSQTHPAFYGQQDGKQSGSSKMLVTGSTNNSSSNLSFSSKTDSSGKLSPVLEKTSPCYFNDKTSLCCLTGKTSPCYFNNTPEGGRHYGSSDYFSLTSNAHVDVFHDSLLSADIRQPRGNVKLPAGPTQRDTCCFSPTLAHPKLTLAETWINQSGFAKNVLDVNLSSCTGAHISDCAKEDSVILNNSTQPTQVGDTLTYSPTSNLKTSPKQKCLFHALVVRPALLTVQGTQDGDTGQYRVDCFNAHIDKSEICETDANTCEPTNFSKILDMASTSKLVSNPDSGYDESMSERTASDRVIAAQSVPERSDMDSSLPVSTSLRVDNSYPTCVSSDEDTEATWPNSSPAVQSTQEVGHGLRSLSSCSEVSHSSDLAHMSNMSQHDSEEDTLPSLSDELLCSWGHTDTLFTVSPPANSVFRGTRCKNLKDVADGHPYHPSLTRPVQVEARALSSLGHGADAETDNLKASALVYGVSDRNNQESQINNGSRANGSTGLQKTVGGDCRVRALSRVRVSLLPVRVNREVWHSKLRSGKREGDSDAASDVKFCHETKSATDDQITPVSSLGFRHVTPIMSALQMIATPKGQRVATPKGQRVATPQGPSVTRPQGQKVSSPQGSNTRRPAEGKHDFVSCSVSGNSLSSTNRLGRWRKSCRGMSCIDWSSANNSNVAGIKDLRFSHEGTVLASSKLSSSLERFTLNNSMVTEQRPKQARAASSAWDLGGNEEDDCLNFHKQRASYTSADSDEKRLIHKQICTVGFVNRALDTALSTPFSMTMPLEVSSHQRMIIPPGVSTKENGCNQVAGYSNPDKYRKTWTRSCGEQEGDQQHHGDMTMICVHLLLPTCSGRTVKSWQDSFSNVIESGSYFQTSSKEVKHEAGTTIAGPSLTQSFNINFQTRPQLSSSVPRSSFEEGGISFACKLFMQSRVRDTTPSVLSISASTLQESTVSKREIQEELVDLEHDQVDSNTLSPCRRKGRNPSRSADEYSPSKDVLRACFSKKNRRKLWGSRRLRKENRGVFTCPETGS